MLLSPYQLFRYLFLLSLTSCLALFMWSNDSVLITEHENYRNKAHGQDGISMPIPCEGPRGTLLGETRDDLATWENLTITPNLFAGSYKALGLDPQWATSTQRYGAYGFRDTDGERLRASVDWSAVNWGELQRQCFQRNKHRFPGSPSHPFDDSRGRLRLRTQADSTSNNGWLTTIDDSTDFTRNTSVVKGVPGDIPYDGPVNGVTLLPKPSELHKQQNHGRTLILLRAWAGFAFHEEDVINLRALIAETALQSGGEYAVMLLLQVRENDKHIFVNEEAYAKAFREANIPQEFQGMTLLWDEDLVKSWYPKVEEYQVYYQAFQATQLVGVFYPEFDHYWQLELDMRSSSHYLTFLKAIDEFSRNEPRKQSLERASYLHIPSEQGEYHSDFLGSINETLQGGSAIWGPLQIPDIPNPVGPKPPAARAEDDHFEWGVGEPADLVVTGPCTWVQRSHWLFRYWGISSWTLGDATPRLFCPPATQRASRTLLLAVHAAQMDKGLKMPSEATLPSFALWHGLKISYPPLPMYQETALNPRAANVYWNGGAPGECLRPAKPLPKADWAAGIVSNDLDEYRQLLQADRDLQPVDSQQAFHKGTVPPRFSWIDNQPSDLYAGFACGEAVLHQFLRLEWQLGLSWWFLSSFPRLVFNVWQQNLESKDLTDFGSDLDRATERHAAGVLKMVRGQWYMPAAWWHPVKTNFNPDQTNTESGT